MLLLLDFDFSDQMENSGVRVPVGSLCSGMPRAQKLDLPPPNVGLDCLKLLGFDEAVVFYDDFSLFFHDESASWRMSLPELHRYVPTRGCPLA